MMKDKRYLYLILFIFVILLLNCSSHRQELKKINNEPPPAPPEIQKTQEPDPKDIPPATTTPIPVEQKYDISTELVLQEKNSTSEQEESSALEEALYAYQDAQLAWEKGELDTALASLDAAYGLILKVKLAPDSPLLQEKNDLRILIAQRIREIYASRLNPVSNNHKTIPLEENKYVLAEIESFKTKERKEFEEGYKRSGLYREMILEELKKAGLPEQLSWIPLIESWFKVRALSRARALGLWQFISSTGYRYGLQRDRWIDERMDPQKATQAAIKYLTELHAFFGEWTTALAAYNCGELRVQNVIRSQHINYLDNFWDLYAQLPRETARFVPRFIAAVLIANNPEKYGFDLPPAYDPLKCETITINRPVKLSTLCSTLGLESSEVAFLNPELRFDATPDGEYQLKIPRGFTEKVLTVTNTLPRWIPPEATYFLHSVRSGETLSGIAQRYRTSASAIARLNGMRIGNLIRIGQSLKIPGREAVSSSSLTNPSALAISPEGKPYYIVQKGDTLSSVAVAFKTTVQKIKDDNSLIHDILYEGQKLLIQSVKLENGNSQQVNSRD